VEVGAPRAFIECSAEAGCITNSQRHSRLRKVVSIDFLVRFHTLPLLPHSQCLLEYKKWSPSYHLSTLTNNMTRRQSSTSQRRRKVVRKGGLDWFEIGVHGGITILTGVRTAAGFTQVPLLKNAADATLTIISMVQVSYSATRS